LIGTLHRELGLVLHGVAHALTGGSIGAALMLLLAVAAISAALGALAGAIFLSPRLPSAWTGSAAGIAGGPQAVAALRSKRARSSSGATQLRLFRVAVALILLWALLWLLLPWPSMQDDALAYLRAARDLGVNRGIVISGVDWSSGRYSLLYLIALTVLHPLVNTILLPRILSIVGCAALLLRLALGLSERARRGGIASLAPSLLLLGVLATPASLFWINDGTETAWVLLAAAALVFAARRVARQGSSSTWPLMTWSVLAVMLRTEMILAVLAVSAALRWWGETTPDSVYPAPVRNARTIPWLTPLISGFGALLVSLVLRLALQAGLPFHLTLHGSLWAAAIASGFRSFAEAHAFGWGLLLLWILTAVAALFTTHRMRSTQAVNVLVPVAAVTVMLFGQQIDFARELAWPLVLASLWNTLELVAAARDASLRLTPVRSWVGACAALALVLLVFQLTEIPLFLRAQHERRTELRSMDVAYLDPLRGLRAIAVDTGFFGYFTGSTICNPGQLLNGSTQPAHFGSRVAACAAGSPDFGFLTVSQAQAVSRRLDLSDWSICQSYFVPLGIQRDQHFLVTSSASANKVCDVAGGFPVSLSSMLQVDSAPGQ
jgi:hypothetical protein